MAYRRDYLSDRTIKLSLLRPQIRHGMYLDCLGTISSAYEYSQLQVIRNIPTGETPQYFDAR